MGFPYEILTVPVNRSEIEYVGMVAGTFKAACKGVPPACSIAL